MLARTGRDQHMSQDTERRDSIYTVVQRRDAVVSLVVAVDRYVRNRAEADEDVRNSLWREMTAANEQVAELFKVYPL